MQFRGTIGASGLTEKFKLTFFKFELSSGEIPKLSGKPSFIFPRNVSPDTDQAFGLFGRLL